MTRLFKVSLSVVALLLVALIVFTGCGKANEALTTAEEAKQAVVDATAELEAALKNKADAKVLSEKVAALTAAIQEAETLAADGDAELNEVIETAKATVAANIEELLTSYKIDVTAIVDGKADKESVYAEIALLKEMVANIETITLAKINLEDYVSWNTVIVAYLYELDDFWAAIRSYHELYAANDWAEIEKAFRLAEVSLYRSFGTDEDTSMIDEIFQALRNTLAKYPNPVDVLYYGQGGVVEYVAAADKSATKAQTLYNKIADAYAAANADAKALIKNYYVINEDNELARLDLVTTTLGYWKAEIADDVSVLGAILPVYTGNTKFANDADNLNATRTQLDAFATAVADNGAGVVTDFTPAELAAFVKNESLMKAIDDAVTGAKVTANAVIAKEYDDAVELTHECIADIKAWNTACNAWINTFLVENRPAVLEGENAERYAEMEALIKDSKDKLDIAMSTLATIATPYIADAQSFVAAVAKYYDADDNLDFNKVTLYSGQDLVDTWALVRTWSDKYEITDLDLSFLGEGFEYVPAVSISQVLQLQDNYNKKFVDTAIKGWNDLADEIAEVAKYIDGTATLTIYDTNVKAVVAWYELAQGDAYGLVVDGEYQTGCTLEALKNATKAYYETVKALEKQLDDLIANKVEKATQLNDALNALANITLSKEADIQAAKDLYTAYTADGASKYVEGHAANATLGIAIDDYATKIAAAEAKIVAIKNAKLAMDNALAEFDKNENKPAAAYPYFGGTAVAQSTYESLITALDYAVNAFVAENQNQKETYTAAADAKIKEATLLVKYDDVLDAQAVVKANTSKVNDLPSYFNADIAKATYASDAEALANAITAYTNTNGSVAANVAAAKADLDDARVILAKEAAYDEYKAIYNNAIASLDAATGADAALVDIARENLDELLANHREQIAAYDIAADDIDETLEADLALFLNLVKGELTVAGVTYSEL